MAKIGLAKLSSFTCNDFPVHRIHEVVCEGGFVAFNFHPSNSHSTHHPYSDNCCQPKDAMLLHLSRWRICSPDDLYPIKIKFAFSTPYDLSIQQYGIIQTLLQECYDICLVLIIRFFTSDNSLSAFFPYVYYLSVITDSNYRFMYYYKSYSWDINLKILKDNI